MIVQLAQNSIDLPQFGTINGPSGLRPEFTNFGSLLSGILGVVFLAAGFIAFFMMFWGAFSYLLAGGDKGKIEGARKRITWAIVGLIVLSLSFAISQYVQDVLLPGLDSPISLVQTAYAAEENLGNIYEFAKYRSVGELVSTLTPVAFQFAAIILVLYFLYAAFLYITAGGGKDNIEKAQKMITHTVVGFVLLMLVYIGMQFLMQYFGFEYSIFLR